MGIKENNKYGLVPYYKMGIKLLTDMQMENVFHNYISLLSKVKQYRQDLEQTDFSELNSEDIDSQIYLMYDNIFSIMGKRGAGKTSVIYTLKNKLQEEYPNDLVLPIIMPEIIPEGQGMTGWILSILDSTVKKLDKQLEDIQKKEGLFANCAYEKNGSLGKQLQRVKDLYYSQDYSAEEDGNFLSAVVNSAMRTQNSFDFGKELTLFWVRLVAAIRKVNGMSGNEQPLIHIFFDDVDLRPEILMSLFSTIIKYLSFPNLMVYVTADENQLYDVIGSAMIRRMGKVEEIQMYGALFSPYFRTTEDTKRIRERINTKLDFIDETPKFYSDKILPPSSRYYLETFDTCQQKKHFIYSYSKERPEVALYDCFTSEIDRYIRYVLKNKTEEERSKSNFLEYNGSFLNIYLSFCGETSRQLGNAVFKLVEFVDELISLHDTFIDVPRSDVSRERFFKRLYLIIFDYCSNMLGILANSNEEKYKIRQILKDIMTYGTGRWGIYINYIYLKDYIRDRLDDIGDNSREALYKQTIPLFILLFFVENILVIESKAKPQIFEEVRDRVHGQGIFIDVLDMFTNNNYSLVWKKQTIDISQFLWFYGTLIDSPQVLMKFDPVEARKVRSYFRCLPAELRGEIEPLATYDRENPKWFRTMAFVLYAAREGLYDLKKTDVILIRLNEKSSDYWDSGIRVELQSLEESLVKILSIPPTSDSIAYQVTGFNNCNSFDILKIIKEHNEQKPITSISDVKNYLRETLQNDFTRASAKRGAERFSLPKAFDSTAASEVYLEAMQAAADKIEEVADRFSIYRIKDLKEFADNINYLEIDYSYQMIFDLRTSVSEADDGAFIASRSDLTRIMKTAFNEIVRKGNMDGYLKSEIDEEERNAYLAMIMQLEYYLQTEQDLENATDLLALFQYFKIMQGLYFQTYLLNRNNPKTVDRIDRDLIPYREMYSQIRNCLSTPTDFISKKLHKYVSDGVQDYLNSLK